MTLPTWAKKLWLAKTARSQSLDLSRPTDATTSDARRRTHGPSAVQRKQPAARLTPL